MRSYRRTLSWLIPIYLLLSFQCNDGWPFYWHLHNSGWLALWFSGSVNDFLTLPSPFYWYFFHYFFPGPQIGRKSYSHLPNKLVQSSQFFLIHLLNIVRFHLLYRWNFIYCPAKYGMIERPFLAFSTSLRFSFWWYGSYQSHVLIRQPSIQKELQVLYSSKTLLYRNSLSFPLHPSSIPLLHGIFLRHPCVRAIFMIYQWKLAHSRLQAGKLDLHSWDFTGKGL